VPLCDPAEAERRYREIDYLVRDEYDEEEAIEREVLNLATRP
jgi:hypothetical protein